MTEFTVPEAEAGKRLDKLLAERFPDFSRSRLKALIEAGDVTLDGASADPARRLRGGEVLRLTPPPPEPGRLAPEPIPLVVVHEDEDLIVIDKPAGLVVHPSAGHETGTLVHALLHHCGESLSGINGVLRPGIVHRLDKDTSGLLVVAKTDAAHRALAAQFADHGREGDLERAYIAFAWGVPARPAFTVEAAIARSTANREKMAVSRSDGARHAVTHAELEATYAGHDGTAVASRLVCRLETGRTHQIRVHLAHIGHPLLGDPLYGAGFRTKETLLSAGARAALQALGRQALHAGLLAFRHPRRDVVMRFSCPPPAEMQALEQALGGAAMP